MLPGEALSIQHDGSTVKPAARRDPRAWQILDVGSIWMKEFASALLKVAPATTAWQPQILATGLLQNWERTEQVSEPPLTIRHFPLQRGYARAPLTRLAPYQNKLIARLLGQTADPANSPLICTTPYYAPVAESWPGPVIYYATDLTFAYDGVDPEQVNRLDRRMCKVARAVCPNSSRIAQYFIQQAECPPAKISVVPNATRESNVSPEPLMRPEELPEDIRHLSRPIAGVLGNLAGNMDWLLLAESVRSTPGLTWVFVGPTTMPIADEGQSAARDWVKRHAHFTGGKSYGQLQSYARAVDVAVLPYQRKEPTFSGSSTRFYEHLAACRPMIATRGFAELLEKPPLLTLIDTAEELQQAIAGLARTGFTDGHEIDRWNASRSGTWEARAQAILLAVPE